MAAQESDVGRLRVIHEAIEQRVEGIHQGRPWWPCRSGCDHCCRHLGDVPSLTAGEWALLRAGLLELSPSIRGEVLAGIEDLAGASAPIVCPMLDAGRGACRVYASRPADCRTYGYYASRSRDLWCHLIDDALERAGEDAPMWGNQAALERRLVAAFGPRRPLPQWLADDPELTPPPRRRTPT